MIAELRYKYFFGDILNGAHPKDSHTEDARKKCWRPIVVGPKRDVVTFRSFAVLRNCIERKIYSNEAALDVSNAHDLLQNILVRTPLKENFLYIIELKALKNLHLSPYQSNLGFVNNEMQDFLTQGWAKKHPLNTPIFAFHCKDEDDMAEMREYRKASFLSPSQEIDGIS